MEKSITSAVETGRFIVLDLFNPDIVNVECDGEGNTLFFETGQAAIEHAEDVQDPLVIELPFGNRKAIVRSNHELLNVVLFPNAEGNDDIPWGKCNHIYFNGTYICRWGIDEYDEYTIRWEAFADIINGLKMATPGLVYRDILFGEAKLDEIFGEKWREYDENGALWVMVEQYLGVQVVEP